MTVARQGRRAMSKIISGALHLDTFTDTNGTAIVSHSAEISQGPYVQHVGGPSLIQSNQLELIDGDRIIYPMNNGISRTDWICTPRKLASLDRTAMQIWYRQGSDTDFYTGYLDPLNTGTLYIYVVINSVLDTVAQANLINPVVDNVEGCLSFERSVTDVLTVSWDGGSGVESISYQLTAPELLTTDDTLFRVSSNSQPLKINQITQVAL